VSDDRDLTLAFADVDPTVSNPPPPAENALKSPG
jgi:hypothetical protein